MELKQIKITSMKAIEAWVFTIFTNKILSTNHSVKPELLPIQFAKKRGERRGKETHTEQLAYI
jgi:hypothetical protein